MPRKYFAALTCLRGPGRGPRLLSPFLFSSHQPEPARSEISGTGPLSV
jgi:hypothetical protein